jgi:Family of unknown function (DUF6529)
VTTASPSTPAPAASPATTATLLIILLVGALVSLLFGVYASVHDPTGETTIALFFSNTVGMKVWLTTAALLFALLQVLTALRLYGKVKVPATFPPWLGDAHRLCGTLAFLLTLPVAFHCLWSFGFESTSSQTRRYVHSLAGCVFYGAFASKVLAVRTKRLPGWVLPVIGGITFTLLVVLWTTSSLWFFQNREFPGF